MLACRRPRLHTYGRGRPYADIETPHYSNIPSFHYSSSSYHSVCSRRSPRGGLTYNFNLGPRTLLSANPPYLHNHSQTPILSSAFCAVPYIMGQQLALADKSVRVPRHGHPVDAPKKVTNALIAVRQRPDRAAGLPVT
jgi:hypothetical protein